MFQHRADFIKPRKNWTDSHFPERGTRILEANLRDVLRGVGGNVIDEHAILTEQRRIISAPSTVRDHRCVSQLRKPPDDHSTDPPPLALPPEAGFLML